MQWPSFFQLPVLMLMLITLLNDGTLISIGYDRVIPNLRPDKWNLRVCVPASLFLHVAQGLLCIINFCPSSYLSGNSVIFWSHQPLHCQQLALCGKCSR